MSFTPLTSTNNLDAPTINAVLTEIDQSKRRMPTGGLIGYQIVIGGTVMIGVAAGVCRDDTDTVDLVRTTASGSINIMPWSGTGANKLDTGSVTINTWYAVFIIGKTDGTVAGLCSLSTTSPTMPSGYVYKRRIGMVRVNASNILAKQRMLGDGLIREVVWTQSTQTNNDFRVLNGVDVSNASYDTVNFATCVPTTAQALRCMVLASSSVANMEFSYRYTGMTVHKTLLIKTSVANELYSVERTLPIDSSQTIEITTSAAATDALTIQCHGYIENLACEIV